MHLWQRCGDGYLPTHLLHGHTPLSRLFWTPEILREMQEHLCWLQAEIQQAMRQGAVERATLHRRTFIPPALLHTPRSQLPYLDVCFLNTSPVDTVQSRAKARPPEGDHPCRSGFNPTRVLVKD